MTALNSEGLKKAANAIAADTPIGQMHRSREIAEKAITAYLSALPPVDGLEVVAWKLSDAKVTLGKAGWAFITRHENPEDYEPDQYEALQADIAAAIPLVTLPQASSVIAGLKEANEALKGTLEVVRNNIPMEYLRRHDVPGATGPTRALDIASAMRDYAEDRWKLIDRLKATEARISSLEEENKRLREALGNAERSFNNIRGAIESNQVVDKDAHGTAIRARDDARQALEDHNG